MKRQLPFTIALFTLALLAAPSHALTNPGFEQTNLNAWNPEGFVEIAQTFRGVVPPTQGLQQAVMYTDRFAVQQNNPAASGLRLGAQLGVDLTTALAGRFIRNGSAIQQQINLLTPANLVFDWAFAHRVDEPSGNDVAFVMIDQQAFILTDLASAPFTLLGDNNFAATQYFTEQNLPILQPGIHDIAFGVVAVDFPAGRSALLVDNVRLIPQTPFFDDPDPFAPTTGFNGRITFSAANPEPATAILLTLALTATTLTTRRRRP